MTARRRCVPRPACACRRALDWLRRVATPKLIPLVVWDGHGRGARCRVSGAICAAVFEPVNAAISRAERLSSELTTCRGRSRRKPLDITETTVGLITSCRNESEPGCPGQGI